MEDIKPKPCVYQSLSRMIDRVETIKNRKRKNEIIIINTTHLNIENEKIVSIYRFIKIVYWMGKLALMQNTLYEGSMFAKDGFFGWKFRPEFKIYLNRS